ncbi:hypothetical protein VTK26DRAFT_5306 [Humicola hyalothermophila]
MDAKPLHQRQKSAGHVKAMSTTGALNAPPKRTAFGDVSNTARNRLVEPAGKEGAKTRVKSLMAPINTRNIRVEDKENKVASKENRPRTTVASKGLAQCTKVQTATSAQAARPAAQGSSHTQQHTDTALAQPPLRNKGPKKTTIVYNERQAVKKSSGSETSPVDDLAVAVPKPAKNPRHYKSQPLLRSEQAVPQQAQSKLMVRKDTLVEAEDEDDVEDDATEAAYEDALERLSQDVEEAVQDALAQAKQSCPAQFLPAHQAPYILEPPRPPRALPDLPVYAESEGYLDDDDEHDLYDEQGYTTAHSFRSHGDNTTSELTTLLAPNVTSDVQRELEKAKAYVLEHQTEEDVQEEAWDVTMVAEYGEEIFAYMREMEANMLPDPHYMDMQTEIQWSMRSVLMDWLVQVHHRFCLLPETLFLTVNCIDRFLSVKVVSLGKLQLVGATALFVAAKYEEINCPSVQEIVYMVDSGYSIDEILKAERFMLSMLQFELGWPGPMSFLRRISKADDYDLETRTLAKYFLEITIMDERFVSSPASYLAAGAHCISRMFLEKGSWTPAHVHYSGYTFSQLKPLIKMMYECCLNPRKHHGAVFEKYSSPKYKHASTFVESKMACGMTLSQLYVAASGPSTSSRLLDEDDLDGPYITPRSIVQVKA